MHCRHTDNKDFAIEGKRNLYLELPKHVRTFYIVHKHMIGDALNVVGQVRNASQINDAVYD